MKPFPWRPGMLAACGMRVVAVADGRLTFPGEGVSAAGHTPDRNDPATLGALLGVVREVHSAPRAYLWPNRGASEWAVYRETTLSQREPLGAGPTEFDALLDAYEAAP